MYSTAHQRLHGWWQGRLSLGNRTGLDIAAPVCLNASGARCLHKQDARSATKFGSGPEVTGSAMENHGTWPPSSPPLSWGALSLQNTDPPIRLKPAQKPSQPTSNHKICTCQSISILIFAVKILQTVRNKDGAYMKFLFPEEMWAHWVRSHDTC